jgi:uncharacterized protein DUF2630
VTGQAVARGGVEPPTFRFSVGRSYQLSYLAGCTPPHSSECEARAHSTGALPAHRNQDHGPSWAGGTVVAMAEDVEIRHRISELVDLERSLREQLSAGEISTDDEHARLRRVETELDQCWDLLRQRQALREFGDDPGKAQSRSEGTVEGYLG